MKEVHIIIHEYYDFSDDISVSVDVCETFEKAMEELQKEKEYTLNHFKECDGGISETNNSFTYAWDNGYHHARIETKEVIA